MRKPTEGTIITIPKLKTVIYGLADNLSTVSLSLYCFIVLLHSIALYTVTSERSFSKYKVRRKCST